LVGWSISSKALPMALDASGKGPGDAIPEELLFPFGDGGCFGCSKSNADGLQLRFFRDGDEVTAPVRIPDRFHGAPGVAHGGIVATVLDEFSCSAAVHLGGSRVVTGELQIRYDRPCPVEREVSVRARVRSKAHPRYLEIDAEIHMDGELLVRSTGKFFRIAAN
jgi:acyl-coenzyme A thioesterase PaaI-like protein